MIINTRDKEIRDQPRLNHFDLKSKSTCNMYIPFTNSDPYTHKEVRETLTERDAE